MPLHRRIFYSGAAILAGGLIAAALIFVLSPPDAPAGQATEIGSGRSYEFQIERIGGKATVYVVRFNQWLGSLWQGRRLAVTVGVLSILIALACFWVAWLVSAPGPDDHERR